MLKLSDPGSILSCMVRHSTGRLCKAATDPIEHHVQQVNAQENTAIIGQIKAYLESHPEEAKPCWISCQTGYFRQAETEEDLIPITNTQLEYVSIKFMSQTLEAMCARFNQRLIKNLRQQDKNVVHKLFYFGAQEEPLSPVWCHDGPNFRKPTTRGL